MHLLSGYIRIAIRNLRRKWLFSTINIIGLAIGISSSVLITLYILDEYSYDSFLQDSDRIYRVNVKARVNGNDIEAAATCPPMAYTLTEEFPEIDDATRLGLWQEVPVIYEDKAFTESFILLADSNFFQFFSFELLVGNPKNTLSGPNKIVLSRKMAMKYFGTLQDVPGKRIEIGTARFSCEIVGIVQDCPSNSHLRYDMIMSMETWEAAKSPYWINNFMYTYFKLREGNNIEETQEKFSMLIDKYVGPEAEEVFGTSMAEYGETNDFNYGYTTIPVRDIHLKSKLTGEMLPSGDLNYVYIFIAVSAFILVIALINFINLFTARSGRKAREVGIRKTVGAFREKLIGQFMTESILQALVALIIAGALVHLTIDGFNSLAHKSVEFNAWKQPLILPGLLLCALIIGILAGVYPAFYLSSFKPVSVLRGEFIATGKKSGLRKILVIIQFAISTGLILSTLVMYRQLTFLQERNLGFDQEQILVIKNGWSLGENKEVFRNKLLEYPFVKGASIATQLPPGVNSTAIFQPRGEAPEDHLLSFYWTDEDHAKVMGMEMRSGRFYSRDFPTDTAAIVLNETAMKRFGWDDPEGKMLLDYFGDSVISRNVIGVVKDFNFVSLHEKIQPLAILYGRFGNLISLKLDKGDVKDMIQKIEMRWKIYSHGAPFDYYFLDQRFNNLYATEARTSRVILVFTVLAILVASLGLFGLATYAAERRTHEIGIRKVMGASVRDILFLLNRDFLKLVFWGILISVPVTLYLIYRWFRNFSYHIDITWDLFLITAGIAFFIALFTVSIRATRAAGIDPVKAIKVE